jgi:hypothetical protein
MSGWIIAVCAVVTLLILMGSTVVGCAIWIMREFNRVKDEILADFNRKHEANLTTVRALEVLVARHDILLNPEFGGRHSNGRSGKQHG